MREGKVVDVFDLQDVITFLRASFPKISADDPDAGRVVLEEASVKFQAAPVLYILSLSRLLKFPR